MRSEKIAALVPMRHHSQRVPGKNYRMIAGKPLYAHIIETLLQVPELSAIVVDTDSDVILEGLNKNYPTVTCLRRPDHLRADDIPMNEILIHDTGEVQADLYLQTHSTNPLLKAETISRGINELLDHYPAYDSVVWGDPPPGTAMGSTGTADQSQPGGPASNTGSAARIRREFLHVYLHPEPFDRQAQPAWRAADDV